MGEFGFFGGWLISIKTSARNESLASIRAKLERDLPHFLDAPMRLTVDSLRYIAKDGRSVGGWHLRAVDKTTNAEVG